jgi:hypothetical protein
VNGKPDLTDFKRLRFGGNLHSIRKLSETADVQRRHDQLSSYA